MHFNGSFSEIRFDFFPSLFPGLFPVEIVEKKIFPEPNSVPLNIYLFIIFEGDEKMFKMGNFHVGNL